MSNYLSRHFQREELIEDNRSEAISSELSDQDELMYQSGQFGQANKPPKPSRKPAVIQSEEIGELLDYRDT
jgi:hypothetical protein